MARDVTERRTILLVDDAVHFRSWLARMLEKWGYYVIEASNGLEALETMVHECPDLVIMDIRMPVMDGLTATRRIREGGVCQNVPVLALSAEAEMESEVLRAGCNQYVMKGEISQLRLAIQSLLEGAP